MSFGKFRYRATCFSALGFPGLGQIAYGRSLGEKFLGVLILFATSALLIFLGIRAHQEVAQALANIDPSTLSSDVFVPLVWQIQKDIQPKLGAEFEYGGFLLTALWVIGVFGAVRLDRSRPSLPQPVTMKPNSKRNLPS